MVGVAGVAVVPLLRRDAEIVHVPAGSGWSDPALVVDELRPGTAPTSTSEPIKTFGSGSTHEDRRD